MEVTLPSLPKTPMLEPLTFSALRVGIVVVIVDDCLLNGPIETAATHEAGAHAKTAPTPAVAGMATEAVQYGFNALEGQCASSNASCGLHGAAQKTGRPCRDRDVLRLLIWRLCVLWLRC